MASISRTAIGASPAVPKGKFIERRSTRHQLSLPLAILPHSDKVMLHQQAGLPRGRTRDISTSGVYFTTYAPLILGSAVAFTLVLPPDFTGGSEVLICAQGKVVRTEPRWEKGLGRIGVAATIEKYEIIKEDPLYLELQGAMTPSSRTAAAAS